MRKLRQHVLARAEKRIDPHIERRAAGERGAFRGAFVTEDPRQIGIEPFRIVARDMGRRAGERAAKRRRLRCRQRRGRVARAVAQRRDRRDIEPALAMQHADQHRARARLAHEPGGRRFAAQRVVDQAGNRGAVAGAGKAMRQAPILERIGRRPPPRFDIGKNLDGCGKTAGSCRDRRSRYFILRCDGGGTPRAGRLMPPHALAQFLRSPRPNPGHECLWDICRR